MPVGPSKTWCNRCGWQTCDCFKTEDIQCPVCGYYCLGKGGWGCIDKPELVRLADKQKQAAMEGR